jgi:biopolymer transport protein ExbD
MIRRTRRHFHEGVEADLNLLPFMDIFVVLIPMFLTTAVFFPMAALRMQASADAAAEAPASDALGLCIEFREDVWIVRSNRTEARTVSRSSDRAEEQLRALLGFAIEGRPGEKDVVIVAQETTRYDDIVHVMDVARAAGLSNVALAPSR